MLTAVCDIPLLSTFLLHLLMFLASSGLPTKIPHNGRTFRFSAGWDRQNTKSGGHLACCRACPETVKRQTLRSGSGPEPNRVSFLSTYAALEKFLPEAPAPPKLDPATPVRPETNVPIQAQIECWNGFCWKFGSSKPNALSRNSAFLPDSRHSRAVDDALGHRPQLKLQEPQGVNRDPNGKFRPNMSQPITTPVLSTLGSVCTGVV